MPQQNNIKENIEAMWFFMRAYQWITSTLETVINWFSPLPVNQPSDAAGELIKRQIANKSWFDEITDWWVKKPAFEKVSLLIASTLLSGFVGLLIGASTLFTLTAAFFSLCTHALFLSHEEHRWAAAYLTAAETISLNGQLKVSSQMLDATKDALHNGIDTLKSQSDKIATHATVLEEQSQSIDQLHGQLAPVVNSITAESSQLLDKTRLVNDEMEIIKVDLEAFKRSIDEAVAVKLSINEPIKDFSATIRACRESHEKFSHATDRFCMFVSAQTMSKTLEDLNLQHPSIAALEAEIDAREKLINQWRIEIGAGTF